MRWFRKKKQDDSITGMPEMHAVTLKKIFEAAGYTPVEFKHSARFILDGEDPLEYERRRLSGLPADWLLKDRRVPAIKADSHREIELGKLQYINHMYSIKTIDDLQSGELSHANDMIVRIDDEIAEYEAEEQRLYALIQS